MKSRYKNAFLVFGLVVLAVMVSQLDFAEVWRGLQRAGYWFPVILVLWALLYHRNRAMYDEPLANPLPKLYHEKRDESEKVRFAIPKKHENSGADK